MGYLRACGGVLRRARRLWRFCLPAGAAALALAGCSLFGGPPSVAVGEVRVRAAADANLNSPVVLSVVVVADQDLEKRLLDPAQNWSDQQAALVAAYPQALQAYSCEVAPGQELSLPASMFKGRHAYAVFVLAGVGQAERRARIDGWRDGGEIAFGRDNWSVTPNAKPASAALQPQEMDCQQSGQAS